jgi:hypothetical protein
MTESTIHDPPRARDRRKAPFNREEYLADSLSKDLQRWRQPVPEHIFQGPMHATNRSLNLRSTQIRVVAVLAPFGSAADADVTSQGRQRAKLEWQNGYRVGTDDLCSVTIRI